MVFFLPVSNKFLIEKIIRKPVKDDKGARIGRINDLIFDEKTGDILGFLVKVTRRNELLETLPRDKEGCIMIPFSALIDFGEKGAEISLRKLRILLSKTSRGKSSSR